MVAHLLSTLDRGLVALTLDLRRRRTLLLLKAKLVLSAVERHAKTGSSALPSLILALELVRSLVTSSTRLARAEEFVLIFPSTAQKI